MKNWIIAFIIMAALMLSFSGTELTHASSKISLSERTLSLEVGTTFKLQVLNAVDEITWETSNKSIAKVSSKGKITAKKAGSCKIYAYTGTKKLTCRVTVYNNYKAESDRYGVTGFSTLMGKLPLKKFKYSEETSYFKELSTLGNKCQVFFGLDAKGVDIVLDSDNYVYFIRNVKKYTQSHPDNYFLDYLDVIADEAYKTDPVTDRDGNLCYALIFRESDLISANAKAGDYDSVDEGFYYIFYPNKKGTDFDCLAIGCDEASFGHISWYKIQ